MTNLPTFDELVTLAKENPEALETLRQQHVDTLICNAPEAFQKRLKGMQFQIDAYRKIHKDSPLGSCMKISQMMHESFTELRGLLNEVSHLDDPLRSIETEVIEPQERAKILAFPSR